jgi:hypothetical protein
VGGFTRWGGFEFDDQDWKPDSYEETAPRRQWPEWLLGISAIALLLSGAMCVTGGGTGTHLAGYSLATVVAVGCTSAYVVITGRRITSGSSKKASSLWTSRLRPTALMVAVLTMAVALGAAHAWPVAQEWSRR